MKKNLIASLLIGGMMAVAICGCGKTEVVDSSEEDVISKEENDETTENDETDEITETDTDDEQQDGPHALTFAGWEQAYKYILSDRSELMTYIENPGTFTEMIVEPSYISGFNVADITGDGVPELLVLAQPAWESCTDQKILIFNFDEKSGEYCHVADVNSQGHLKGDFDAYKGVLSDDCFILAVGNNYNCVVGTDANGKLITFSHGYDQMLSYNIRRIDIDAEKNRIRISDVFSEDILSDDAGVIDFGDYEEAEQVLAQFKPMMFYDINENNIAAYVNKAYVESGLNDYTAEEVMDFLAANSRYYMSLDKNTLTIDGYIDSSIAYNYKFLMQWYVSSDV